MHEARGFSLIIFVIIKIYKHTVFRLVKNYPAILTNARRKTSVLQLIYSLKEKTEDKKKILLKVYIVSFLHSF